MDSAPLVNLTAIAFLRDLRTKAAFTPSPAVAQMAAVEAQGAAPPGASLPAGGPPGMPPGMPPGGAPPGAGPDPTAGGAPPGAPPGMPPGAAPPPDGGAVPPGPADAGDPLSQTNQKLDQLIQLFQTQQAGGGAPGGGPGGAPGKPNLATVKFEPAHMHQILHKLHNQDIVLQRIADAMGIQVPASAMLNQPTPAPPSSGVPGAGGPADATAQAGQASQQAAGGQSPLVVQLPQLPPVAAKAAAGLPIIPRFPSTKKADNRLVVGRAVPPSPAPAGNNFAAVADVLGRRKGQS